MTGRALGYSLVAAFSVLAGHIAWHARLGPTPAPDYFVGGPTSALAGTDPAAQQLYLRRKLHLSARPRHAWLQVLGRDMIQVFVNGRLAGGRQSDGFAVAVLIDLAPLLHAGTNVVAIEANRTSLGAPPAVAVEGAYSLAGEVHPLDSAGRDVWRCAGAFERHATWWFAGDFDDRHWAFARPVSRTFRAKLAVPPGSVTAPVSGRWVAPPASAAGLAAVRHEFRCEGRPRRAWLRMMATSSYRLALNGLVLDEQEDQMGTTTPVPPVLRTYDLTTVVRPGRNVLSLAFTATSGPPRFLADLETEGEAGRRASATGASWLGRPGLPPDWLAGFPDDPRAWLPCEVEEGDMGVPPWLPRREGIALKLPPTAALRRTAGQLGVVALAGLLTLVARGTAARLLAACPGAPGVVVTTRAVDLALALPGLAMLVAVLAAYDPRVASEDVYRPITVGLAALLVLAQWVALALAAAVRPRGTRPGTRRPPRAARAWALVVGLTAVAFGLRFDGMTAEPLHPDEVTILRAAKGLLCRGFPSFEINKDLPIYYICGCELESVGPALASLFLDEDRAVVRLPSVCLGALTVPLLFVAGRRLFGTPVGLVAAAVYTFSPACIVKTHFGRYPSLLQVMTLLTVHFFSKTVAGPGPVDRRALWLTSACFLGMFFSWEASALIAPGMILAAIEARRGRLRSLFGEPTVWAASGVVLVAVFLQQAHIASQQTKFLIIGPGWGDVKLTPMWRYPVYTPWRYVWMATWGRDTLFPMLGLAGAVLLAVRHGYRRPARTLLLIFVVFCVLVESLLPVIAMRYSYHLIPLVILLCSASLVAAVRAVSRGVRGRDCPAGWLRYARGVGAVAVVTTVAAASGLTIQTTELPRFQNDADAVGLLKISNLEDAVAYVRDRFRPGDVVIATFPDSVNHHMAYLGGVPSAPDWETDYWLETTIQLPAVLDDRRDLPLHRWCGTPMVSSLEALEDVFARSGRVWYVTVTGFHEKLNDANISEYINENMDVAFEGFQSMVMVRDANRRTAAQRLDDEHELKDSKAALLQ